MRVFSTMMVYHLADVQNRCTDDASKHKSLQMAVQKFKVLDLTNQ